MKYVDTMVTFSEFPHEIALCINISGCPNHCKGCHSPYLAEDIGTPLNQETLRSLLKDNEGITCLGFLGGDQNPLTINELAKWVKEAYPSLKVGWYSGKEKIPDCIESEWFDYLKYGPYIEELGPLTSPTTNQHFLAKGEHLHKMSAYKGEWYDVTNWF